MTILKTDDARLAEAETLLREDEYEAKDRATLGAFYNGRATMPVGEAKDRGISELKNHLFGFDSMNTARGYIDSLITKDPNMFEIRLPNADPFDKQRLEHELTKELNRIIKRSRRLKGPWKGLGGDLTLVGSGMLMWTDPWDWCPILARPLVPRGTKTSAKDIPYACLPEYLSIGDMQDAVEKTEKAGKNGGRTGWDVSALRKLIRHMEGNTGDRSDHSPTLENTPPDKLEEMRQNSSKPQDHVRLKFPVFYWYERNDSGGFDLTIIARQKNTERNSNNQPAHRVDLRLFHKKDYYESPEQFITPFFLDCNIGGETTWHRTMGLGRLNYDNDLDVEEFFNEAMEGSKEQVRRTYKVANAANTEMIDRWINDPSYSNIMPEGLDVAEVGKNTNFQFAFTIIEQLRQLSKSNSGDPFSNTDDKRVNELEVQAIANQGRAAAAISHRMNDIYDDATTLGEEIVRRFLNTNVLPVDKGYEEIKEFQEFVLSLGLSPEILGERKENGGFANIEVKIVKSAGDGDRVRELMTNRMLMERLHLFGPEAQKEIIRRVTASETQDHDLAQALVPQEEKISPDQLTRANQENDTCEKRGITGHVPKIADEDIDLLHIPEHVGGMAGMVARGEADLQAGRHWTKTDVDGFRCMGAHTVQHLNRVSQIPEQRQIAAEWTTQLQVLGRRADALIQAAQQAQQAQQIAPEKQADLQLKAQKQKLAERAQLKLEEHREDALAVQRHKQGFEESARDEQLRQSQSQIALQAAVAGTEQQRKERELELAQQAPPAQE